MKRFGPAPVLLPSIMATARGRGNPSLRPRLLQLLREAGVSQAQIEDWQRPETLALFKLSGLNELPGMEQAGFEMSFSHWERPLALAARIVDAPTLLHTDSWFEILLLALQPEEG